MRRRVLRASGLFAGGLLAIVVASPRSAIAQEGGIEVFAAETLFSEGWRVSASWITKRRDRLFHGDSRTSDPQHRSLEEHRAVLGVDYGLLPELTLSLLVPSVYREARVGSRRLESFGLGDVAALGKFRLFKVDGRRRSFNLSLVGGLELPTGETRERDDGGRLDPTLQPGSGSWDPFAALTATGDLDLWRFDAHAFYKLNTEGAQDFREGDFFSFEVDAAYRFFYTEYPGPTASARVGLQWRQTGRSKQDGRTREDSGSHQLFLRPGLSYHPIPALDVSVSVDIPLYQYFHGRQLALDYRWFAAIGLRF